jgi:hypothetical protein
VENQVRVEIIRRDEPIAFLFKGFSIANYASRHRRSLEAFFCSSPLAAPSSQSFSSAYFILFFPRDIQQISANVSSSGIYFYIYCPNY